MDKLIVNSSEQFWFPEVYARDSWIKAQAALLAPGSKVLDAGAGASKYRPLFAHCDYKTQDFCKYEGPLVKYLQPIDYVCEITNIPLPDQSLDAIICTEVFEHVVDPMAVLTEFQRLLKPGGKLWLTSPFLSHVHMEPYHYYGGFTHYWYRHWLPKKGFKVDAITPVGGPGRTAAVFCQTFYTAWSAREKQLELVSRAFSMLFRAPAKVLAHYLLPWLLPRFDRRLGADLVCSGYLVTATRDGAGQTPR